MKSAVRHQTTGQPIWWDPTNNKAMLICRVSDKSQLDGVSLDAQAFRQVEYAMSCGLAVAGTEKFQESAKESSLRERFHQAKETARQKQMRHLVFLSVDRLARTFTDMEKLEVEIRKGTFIAHFVAERRVLWHGSPDADFFLLDIATATSKQENRIRSSKTIDGMEQRCRQGWYPSRPPTFYVQEPLVDDEGRRKRRGSTVSGPDEQGRKLLRREMELRLEGATLSVIQETCVREGLVPAKTLPSYFASSVDKHLKNIFYAALEKPHDGFTSHFVWRGVTYDGRHEPIFSFEEWNQLQHSFGLRSTYRKVKHEGLFNRGPLRLKCAMPRCECAIAYAPVTKSSGQKFRYYDCADGRRVHRDARLSQVNVREESILDQLGTALDSIALDAGIAIAIADALNTSHRAARAKRERLAQSFAVELEELQAKENRLVDHLHDETIDAPTFKVQQARLRGARAACLDKVKASQAAVDEDHLVTAYRVLELAESAKKLWEGRSDRERVDLLERVVSNPRLEGNNVLFSLEKPFAALAKMRESGEWRPYLDEFRTAILSMKEDSVTLAVRFKPSARRTPERWCICGALLQVQPAGPRRGRPATTCGSAACRKKRQRQYLQPGGRALGARFAAPLHAALIAFRQTFRRQPFEPVGALAAARQVPGAGGPGRDHDDARPPRRGRRPLSLREDHLQRRPYVPVPGGLRGAGSRIS